MSRSVEIKRIRMDGGTQPRAELNREVVDDYAEAWKQGAGFPAVVVFNDGSDYWLADGFHRVNSAILAGRAMIDADVRQGTRRDAVLFACGANHGHGLRRTNADKRRAVETLLRDEEWQKWSDREIATKASVGHAFVSSLRPAICPPKTDAPSPVRTVSRNGTTYTQNTANIGKKSEPKPAPAEPEPLTVFEWECEKCGELFPIKLKHCGFCDHHYPLADVTCSNCHKSLRGMPETKQVEPVPFLPLAEVKAVQAAASEDSETKFNRTNNNVEWALWTWNPVTGCEHDCDYCYARDIANRFYPQKFAPTFHPGRIGASKRTPFPTQGKIAMPFNEMTCSGGIGEKNVFTCSMADLFGKWVPQEWIDAVMDEVRSAPQWNFLFLTKFPQRLVGIDFPDNAWVGTTVDTQARVKNAEESFKKIKAGVKWLSCEPMLTPLKFTSLDVFDWVVIGGQSKSTQCPEFHPPFDWIGDLYAQAANAGCRIYMKTNLLPERIRQYPESARRNEEAA